MTSMTDDTAPVAAPTKVDRASDTELVVTRTFAAPARTVFEAWSDPAIFPRWWVPESSGLTLLSCEMDVRTAGSYRLAFAHPMADQPIAFFGTYTDIVANERMVWTNDEGEDGAITTVTFEETAGRTLVTYRERYPARAALDAALAGSAEALPEQFAALDRLLAST